MYSGKSMNSTREKIGVYVFCIVSYNILIDLLIYLCIRDDDDDDVIIVFMIQ